MIRTGIAAATVLAFAAGPAAAQEKTVKIGFISTFSGPPAAIGNDMRNSFELGLDHLGRKLGGLPVEVIYEDDQLKPEVGVQKTQKLIESDKVDFVVGYIWSNVILASLKPLVDSKTMTVVTNDGIHGAWPRTICLICLALMWLEAVLGLCLGCELYGLMVRRGWRRRDDAFEVCAGGACDLDR